MGSCSGNKSITQALISIIRATYQDRGSFGVNRRQKPSRFKAEAVRGGVEAPDCICNTIWMHQVRLAKGVEQDLKRIPLFYRNRILDAIEIQLTNTPDAPTKNRKLLENLITPWEAVPPIWELRVGEYRVFYDVSEEEAVVYIRAIRRKPRGKRTEDIL